MKRLMMMTVAISMLAQAVHAEDRSDADEFYGINKNKASTQALLGTGEGLLAALALYQASKGPKSVLPKDGSPGAALRASRQNYKLLEEFRKTKGAGLIRSVKFLGASILIVDAGGRVYEWFAMDSKPHWSPVYSFLMAEGHVPLDAMPQSVERLNPADSVNIPAMDSNELSMEAELTKKLSSRAARISKGYRDGIENQLAEVKGRIESSKQAVVEATKKKEHADQEFKSSEEKRKSDEFHAQVTGDFYKTRPSAEDAKTVNQVFFGGDLLGSTLLIKSLFTVEGAKAVRDAEALLQRAEALKVVKSNKLGALPKDDGSVVRAEFDKMLEDAKTQLELAKRLKTDAVSKASAVKQAEAAIQEIVDIKAGFRTGNTVTQATRNLLVKLAEKNLAETRALAIRTSRGGSMIRSVKVVGTAVLIGDGIGRAFQWYNQDANPQFSPGITWALMHAEKPVEQMWESFNDKIVEPSKDYFQKVYEGTAKKPSSLPPDLK